MARTTIAISGLTLLAAWSGCAAPVDAAAIACGGERPALEDCDPGVYDADCGGTGDPTFACSELGPCRWFATECLPAGHRGSDCPAGDLCCHGTADGPWPFDDGWQVSGMGSIDQIDDIAIVGGAVVRADEENLHVTLDPSLVSAGTGMVDCIGAPEIRSLCGRPIVFIGPNRSRDTFAIELAPHLYGATIILEVRRLPDGTHVGHAYVGDLTDVFLGEPPRSCLAPSHRGAPVQGTLRIERLDTLAHFELVLDVPGGQLVASR